MIQDFIVNRNSKHIHEEKNLNAETLAKSIIKDIKKQKEKRTIADLISTKPCTGCS